MFINSLNYYNIKSRDSLSQIDDYNTSTSLPGHLILAMIVAGFFAVLNSELFQIYFYDGYGYIISNFCTIASVIILLISSRFRIKKTFFNYLIIMMLTAVYCLISARLTHGGYRYAGVIFNTMGVVLVLRHCKISKKSLKIVFALLCIAAVYSCLTVKGYYETQFEDDSVNSNYLAYFGIVVMIYGNLLLTYFRKRETIFIQLLRIFLCIGGFYIIWECQSRGALLAWIFYIVCIYVLPHRIFKNKKLLMCIALGIVIVGVVFSHIYVNNISVLTINFMGKTTATRFRLWSYFWSNIFQNKVNCLIGYGTHSALREIFGYGLHNIYIGIWYDIGLIGLIIFMGFILWNIKESFRYNQSLSIPQIYAIIGFLSFMIYDYFAVTFTGPLVVWNYAMLGLFFYKEIN